MTRYFTLQNNTDTAIASGDVLGQIGFAASSDSDGGDAIVISAAVIASADGTFDATNNPGSLVFATSPTGPATGQIKIVDSGHFEPIGNKIKNLGSSSSQWKDLYVDQIYFDGLGPQTLPFNDFNVSATGDTVTVTDGNTVSFTGQDSVTVSRNGQTIIISGAAGGGGTPGGNSTEFQFNDGGSFNGTTGVIYTATDGTGTIFEVHGTGQPKDSLFSVSYTGVLTPTTVSIYNNDGQTDNTFQVLTEDGGSSFTVSPTGKIYYNSSYSNVEDSGATTGNFTFDLDKSNMFFANLSGTNRTITLANQDVGQRFIIRIEQSGTGHNTVSWFSNVDWPGGTEPTLSTGVGDADLFGFLITSGSYFYDGFTIATGLR